MLPPNLISPCTADIDAGRSTSADFILKELLETGVKYKQPVPICASVYSAVLKIQETRTKSSDNYADVARAIEEFAKQRGSIPSVIEMYYWLTRVVLVLLVLGVAIFFITEL